VVKEERKEKKGKTRGGKEDLLRVGKLGGFTASFYSYFCIIAGGEKREGGGTGGVSAKAVDEIVSPLA